MHCFRNRNPFAILRKIYLYNRSMKNLHLLLVLLFFSTLSSAQTSTTKSSVRQHQNIDDNWQFAFGHPFDVKKDFNSMTGYFSHLAKAGYADGAAAAEFDDRSWRKLNLPHDWAVEAAFSDSASFSHGFKAIGRKFADKSIGWYRKRIKVSEADLGKRITLSFDGVFRNSIVWLNGHYLGTAESGYNGFEYDISELINYGGDNVIAVRVDATLEEGWFYEGAGIYRHVWLNKMSPLHLVSNGTVIETSVAQEVAAINTKVVLKNNGNTTQHFEVLQEVYDRNNHLLKSAKTGTATLQPYFEGEYSASIKLADPKLWSVEAPYLHHLVTTVLVDNKAVDQYSTRFGIRTISFDANKGFFLNGKRVEIKGTNNHQEHAGVGAAIPDELQYFRIRQLKAMGSNAYRCSHNPPTPELLDACDSLGMLVIDENRLMGVNAYHLNNIEQLIKRDRNHPSVISWSIGNEEWNIENTIVGARIAETMQAFVKSLDTTRAVTLGFSGGWGKGLSAVIDLMGYNYIAQEDPDAQHQKFPQQKGWGTEEGSTFSTRGIYVTSDSLHYKSAYDAKPRLSAYSIEEGWNYYVKRPFLAGMFIWTGFDYRGEPTPYKWPSTGSYFGMLDQCGFPKDIVWYLRSWWGSKPVLHVLPHWNWKGREGAPISVWAYSNYEQVELFLNGKSQGKKSMVKNGHLEWIVPYAPGTLKAVGYKAGKPAATEYVRTTGQAAAITLVAQQSQLKADGRDLAIITVSAVDKNGSMVPDANNEIVFSISGPGKIIGVGNGNPTSVEPDQYLDKVINLPLVLTKELAVVNSKDRPEISSNFDDSAWNTAFSGLADTSVKSWVYRGQVDLTDEMANANLTFFYQSIGQQQSIYVNGKPLAVNVAYHKEGDLFNIDKKDLKAGVNTIAILAVPIKKVHDWDAVNTNPGVIQFKTKAGLWKRKLFNGLAQIIVQSADGGQGTIKLEARGTDLKKSILVMRSAN
jgi:beta-galactosidase